MLAIQIFVLRSPEAEPVRQRAALTIFPSVRAARPVHIGGDFSHFLVPAGRATADWERALSQLNRPAPAEFREFPRISDFREIVSASNRNAATSRRD
jgi:hypothetical protein